MTPVTTTNDLLCTQKDAQNGSRCASRTRTKKLLKADLKASLVAGSLKTGRKVVVGCDGGVRLRRSSDDLWIEEQKKYKCKLARAIRGSLGQLNTLISEDVDKVRCNHSPVSCQRSNLGYLSNAHLLPSLHRSESSWTVCSSLLSFNHVSWK